MGECEITIVVYGVYFCMRMAIIPSAPIVSSKKEMKASRSA